MKPETLVIGTVYHIPSGLGGVFEARYMGKGEEREDHPGQRTFAFRVVSKGWTRMFGKPYVITYVAAEVAEQVEVI